MYVLYLKIATAPVDVGYIEYNVGADCRSLEGRRIASSLFDVDAHRRKGLTTVVADHQVSLLPVPLPLPETDIAAVKGRSDDTVRGL